MDPSFGNPKPRLWRLPADEATQVHYGLPNDGSQRVAARLANVNSPVPLGINLVNTNRVCESARTSTDDDSVDTILDDYVVAAARLQPWASYLMLNLSCPNTIDGRGFFEHGEHLSELLRRLEVQRVSKPIFLKLSPSLDDGGLGELLGAVDAYPNVRGFMFNLSPRFRSGLKTPAEQWKHRPGAVSGAPIRDWMDDRVGWLYRQIDSARYHIIAAGGVSSGENAYRKIRRGASLVQLYTALIYHGPGVVRQIARGLSECLRRDGFERVEDAVGVDAK